MRTRSTPLRLALAAAALALGLSAAAQDSPQRVELKRTELSGAPGMEVVSSIAEYKPGETLARHIHHGVESALVLQGATIQLPGQAPMLLATGTVVQNLRDVPHAGFQVVGDTSLKLFTVHVVDKGKPLYDAPR